MWRGPAGYQGLRSIHKGQEVWEPCHWGSSYLISTKPVTCMSCCTAHMWGHDGWKKKLKDCWKKSKEHITDFLEIMRFFSILWVTSLSGNPPEIYSGQIHHMNTMRRGPMSASARAHHPRGRSRNTSSWGLVLHDYVYVCLHLCLYWQSTGWDWEVTGIEEVAMVSIFEVGKWG